MRVAYRWPRSYGNYSQRWLNFRTCERLVPLLQILHESFWCVVWAWVHLKGLLGEPNVHAVRSQHHCPRKRGVLALERPPS